MRRVANAPRSWHYLEQHGPRLAPALAAPLLAAALAPPLDACDSTGCLLVTRSASGLLPRKAFRLDLSYRMTDDSPLMSGSDLGGRSRFLQVDAAYGRGRSERAPSRHPEFRPLRPSTLSLTRQPSLAPSLLLISLLASCGGSSTSPSAPPVATPAPTSSSGPTSLNMALRSQLNLAALGASAGSGNWGYTAPDGRRFALVGTSVGLSVVDVTNPASARLTGTIVGGSSAWREVRTYREFAYVTTEAQTGLDIVDLRDPDRPMKLRTWNETFASAHSLWIDEDRGLLFANGTQSGMHVLDLAADPENPRELGRFTDFYVHDCYTRGNRLYAAAIRNGFLATLDVTRPEAIREISRFSTGGTVTHNAWLTRDGRYLFTTDERAGSPLEGWDLLASPPARVSSYIGAPGTIPHNVMIDGDRLVVSHYTEGVHMLDVRDPERPRLMGYYDTYPGASSGFNGAWGAYIFPGSNLIVVDDVNGGLFVVEYTGS